MNICELPFRETDILIPKKGFEKWSTVACDQFTSEPQYWRDVARFVGEAPSALRITLPEIYLSDDDLSDRIAGINKTMSDYLEGDIFATIPASMIHVERTLPGGLVRHGIVGAIDLEAYDFAADSTALIRATEGTVTERIPARVKIRRGAPLEIPHAMILFDDPENTVIGPLTTPPDHDARRGQSFSYASDAKKPLYAFPLMMGGGYIKGYRLTEDEMSGVKAALAALDGDSDGENPLLFAVGDGNHSLAAAKQCYLSNPTEKNRWAMVELVNIHDPALEFEPIYRVLFGVDPDDVISELKKASLPSGEGHEVAYVAFDREGVVRLGADTALAVGGVQAFIDEYIDSHPDAKVDYIHGEEVTRHLAREKDSVGFIFDGMRKDELFPAVKADGALPRKTFSMGEAQSKRYYLEARRIDPIPDEI